ncbi:MAG: type I-E CRISPR-associated protein Cse1/CasA [Chloroflexi bacterium]|nr:MAG: type I-E CRISPR-associated protein Cse1/CasA [Chloroflexota bacterium]
MTYSFNLLDQPWIPCTDLDVRMEELSLRETLARAHELRAVQSDSPLETASLYRLLLAVIHSVLRGPKTKDEWASLWQARLFDMNRFDDYFKKWHTRFDLFDKERPFYQVKGNRDGRDKVPNDVLPDVASGTNATLFSHTVDENNISLHPPKAARTLLVMQTMSIAGGWGMAPKESSDAPWGRGVIFLTEDDTLFDTLMLNLFIYPDNQVMPHTKDDLPAWESENPFKPQREQPLGYLDFFTWQNKQVTLIPEGDINSPVVKKMKISQGLRIKSDVLDPMKHYRIDDKKKHVFLRYSEERALWRDSATFFSVRNEATTRPPHAFLWLAELADDEETIAKHQIYRFMALGIFTKKADAKIDFYRHETFPLPLKYLKDNTLLGELTKALSRAEEVSRAVWSAGNQLAVLMVSPSSDGKSWKEISKLTKEDAAKLFRHWGVERVFWSRLEVPFYEFLQTLPEDESALDRWYEALRQTAREALDGAERMAGESVNALKAAVKARGVLEYQLNQLFQSQL